VAIIIAFAFCLFIVVGLYITHQFSHFGGLLFHRLGPTVLTPRIPDIDVLESWMIFGFGCTIGPTVVGPMTSRLVYSTILVQPFA